MRDKRLLPSSNVAKQTLDASVSTLTASATTKVYDTLPGFAFQVVKVEVFATGTILNTTVDVQIGGVSVLTGAITPVSATRTNGTLVTALAGRRGSVTQALTVNTICGATPTAANLAVTITIRPYPLNGEG